MTTKVNVRSAFYPHERVTTETPGPSMTQQNFKDETDINNILAKYAKTGLIDHINKYGGHYSEMPDESDFHAAMNLVTNAQSMFAELPSGIRANFDNDPALFLDFLDDPENRDEAIEMGLFPAEDPEPVAEDKTPSPKGEPTKEPVKETDEAPTADKTAE